MATKPGLRWPPLALALEPRTRLMHARAQLTLVQQLLAHAGGAAGASSLRAGVTSQAAAVLSCRSSAAQQQLQAPSLHAVGPADALQAATAHARRHLHVTPPQWDAARQEDASSSSAGDGHAVPPRPAPEQTGRQPAWANLAAALSGLPSPAASAAAGGSPGGQQQHHHQQQQGPAASPLTQPDLFTQAMQRKTEQQLLDIIENSRASQLGAGAGRKRPMVMMPPSAAAAAAAQAGANAEQEDQVGEEQQEVEEEEPEHVSGAGVLLVPLAGDGEGWRHWRALPGVKRGACPASCAPLPRAQVNAETGERYGPKGKEPTRFGERLGGLGTPAPAGAQGWWPRRQARQAHGALRCRITCIDLCTRAQATGRSRGAAATSPDRLLRACCCELPFSPHTNAARMRCGLAPPHELQHRTVSCAHSGSRSRSPWPASASHTQRQEQQQQQQQQQQEEVQGATSMSPCTQRQPPGASPLPQQMATGAPRSRSPPTAPSAWWPRTRTAMCASGCSTTSASVRGEWASTAGGRWTPRAGNAC